MLWSSIFIIPGSIFSKMWVFSDFTSFVLEVLLRVFYLLLLDPCQYPTLVLCGKCRIHRLRLPVNRTSHRLLQPVSFVFHVKQFLLFVKIPNYKNASYYVEHSMGRQQCVGLAYWLSGTSSNYWADATVWESKICEGKHHVPRPKPSYFWYLTIACCWNEAKHPNPHDTYTSLEFEILFPDYYSVS